jgi:hypothetical protein
MHACDPARPARSHVSQAAPGRGGGGWFLRAVRRALSLALGGAGGVSALLHTLFHSGAGGARGGAVEERALQAVAALAGDYVRALAY